MDTIDNDNVNKSAVLIDPKGYEIDYLTVLPEAQALSEDELLSGPTDVETTSKAVFTKGIALAELESDAATLPKFDLHSYRQLNVRTRALCHAESEHKMAEAPPAPISEKVSQLHRNRSFLLAQAEVLMLAGSISGVPIQDLKFNTNDRQVASNTRHVCIYFKNHWEQIAPHTTMTPAKLAEYIELADEVHTALSARDEQPKLIAEKAKLRRQFFTLVFKSLAEVKRAAEYFHGDKADRFVPAVFANLGKRYDRKVDVGAPEAPAPATPVAVPAVPVAAVSTLPAVAPGMPGANPYMR